MSSHPESGYTEIQRREAADWFVIINAEEVPSADTLQAWLQWMEARDSNRLAFESVAQAWHSTPESPGSLMPTAIELLDDRYDPDVSVAQWNATQLRRTGAPTGRSAARKPYRMSQRRWLAAASLVALTLGGSAYMWHLRGRGMQNDEFATRTGEQIQITLADGSSVWLGPRSQLSVGFTPSKRNLQLFAGEAYFSVKKDKSRPFVVHSEGGSITAVGTAFNVRDVDHSVLLTVSEGSVTVKTQHDESSKESAVRVASGEQVTFAANSPPSALKIKPSAALGERARWREGILVYRDEPLNSVVKDISRYRAAPLEIPDAAVGEMRYSGVLYINALDEWLAALPESFPVRIVAHDGKEEIRPR
jgi:transmembrane sensor